MYDLTIYTRDIVIKKIINGEEVWRPIDGFSKLFISSNGRVCSIRGKSPKILKCRDDKDGYRIITLREGCDISKTFKVHRLVALHFLDNPYKYPLVNHIDGNISNNCVTNLEWCNHSHNLKEALRIGLIPKRAILCLNKDRSLVRIYNNISEILLDNYKYDNIYACLTGRTKTAYGLVWEYKS